jgi:Flp pilus assembly protein TadD
MRKTLSMRLNSIAPVLVFAVALPLAAQDFRISIPRRSKPTPIQKYNQEGVKALHKNKIENAKKNFYKAYLLDPNDPFTLNNLGYIAELEGDVDRATRYYDLASANSSEAIVDKASLKSVVGRPVSEVAGRTEKGPLEINRMNVRAMGLIQKERPLEAQRVLERALQRTPQDPFTLNNLGFAMEQQGELQQAMKYYTQAANLNSDERVIVTTSSRRNWRGKKITEVARDNAKKMSSMLREQPSIEDQVARLNLRGVSALNRNDRKSARTYFEQANKLDPQNAFTLNNMGYVAELDGDRETANYLYGKARAAEAAGAVVGVATRKDAEGRPLYRVSDRNENDIAALMEAARTLRRQSGGQVQLKRRDGTPVVEPATPPRKQPESEQPQEPQPDQPRL